MCTAPVVVPLVVVPFVGVPLVVVPFGSTIAIDPFAASLVIEMTWIYAAGWPSPSSWVCWRAIARPRRRAR